MSTKIEWTQRPGTTGETWNPVVGCSKVSTGCKHCYAKTVHDKRHKAYLAGKLQDIPQYAHPFEKVQLMKDRLTLPLKWKKPRTVFVNSVSDLFHPDVPFDFILRVWMSMAQAEQHTFIVLTKRPQRMSLFLNDWLPGAWGLATMTLKRLFEPIPNVWLGASVENQATANERIPHLLKCPAAVRFLSCEPLLGPVEISEYLSNGFGDCGCSNCEEGFFCKKGMPFHGIDWVIAGGESGKHARPMYSAWACSLRDQCADLNVPFFFKQWGRWSPGSKDGKGVVVLNDGTTEDYSIGSSVRLKHGIHKQAALKPEVMHAATKGSNGHLLDSKEHHEWPQPTQSGNNEK